MRAITLAPTVVGVLFVTSNLFAGAIDVNTGATATATYGTAGISAGPFPWSDLGFTAGATVSNGQLQVQTGGSTAYNFNSTISGGESFVPGSTTLNVGYTPGWSSSSFNTTTAATGDLNSNFVWNIGPFNGSKNLFNVPLNAPGANADLSGALNGGGGSVNSFELANGPGVSASLTLSAQAFFVTVASATIGIHIGTQIQQSITASPNVTYGDLVWYDTSQTYNAADTFTTETGGGGNILNTFEAPPGSLGLVNGETFYMNILPFVALDMPVTNDSTVNVPASIFASWDVFGASGSANFPLGNLFTLGTGPQTFDFNPTFYGSQFYSVPLIFSETCGTACFVGFRTPPSTTGPNSNNGGIPGNLPPGTTVNCLPGEVCPPPPGGYGNTPMDPLIPVCDPNNPNNCITGGQVTSSPEPDAAFLLGAGLLLLAVSRRWVKRKVDRM